MKTVMILAFAVGVALAGCARSGPPAPVDIRGVGAGEVRPGMASGGMAGGVSRYGSSSSSGVGGGDGFSPPSGSAGRTGSGAVQVQTLGEPDDAYSQSAKGGGAQSGASTKPATSPAPAAAPISPSSSSPYSSSGQLGTSSPTNRTATSPSPSPSPASPDEPRTLLPSVPPIASTSPSEVASASALGDGSYGWPLRGEILSKFGPQSGGLANDGLNIAGSVGDRVYASKAGEVSYAGNELRHLGNVVLVRHAGGVITVYAHLDQIYVSKGDNVLKGQPLGTVGQTGSVDEPQLHFEIRKDSVPLDPIKYLGK